MPTVTTSRKSILDYLQHKLQATALELSRALKMTPANVRHHLGVLIDEGAVELATRIPPHGRGRPSLLYALTQKSHIHNLDGLAHALLDTYLNTQPVEERSELLRQIARYLAINEELKPVNLTHRLNLAIQHLNKMSYQARWEAHSEAPRLLLGHCPYAAILPDHPELCQMDTYLLEELLGVPARQTKKRAQDSRGARYCLFITEKTNP
jgi:predicted ArsR family transcriptional regulator